MDARAVVTSLDQAWQAWAELGITLDDQRWDLPTRLDGWTVKHVYAHHSGFPAAIRAGVEAPDVEKPITHTDAAALLRFMQQPGGIADSTADELQRQAIESTGSHSTAELVEQFTAVAPQVVDDLRGRDLDRRIDYGGLAVITAGEALRIFLMEAVVHYFDMATALDLPVPGPMSGEPLRATAQLLAEVADPVALIEAATGRGQPRVFPVLR